MASVKLLDIVNIFTQTPMDLIIQEDCERTTMSFGLQKEYTLLPNELPTTLISERDGMTIRWKQMDSDEFDNTNYLSGQANWNDFKEEYDAEDENTELSINISEPTLKSKACLKCLYFTKIISDLCCYLEYFSYLYTIN